MRKHKLIIKNRGRESVYICDCLEDAENMMLILKGVMPLNVHYEIKEVAP